VQQKRQDPLQQSMNQVTNATNKSTTTVAVVKKKIMFTVMFAVIFKGQCSGSKFHCKKVCKFFTVKPGQETFIFDPKIEKPP
jgi:aromatic ring-opening dioxygenase LigB subunit